ncbi:MAG: hypothetical protein FJX23_00255 [Alphaproteobacteria bacterium]|nr:hypothetical protein [Alphaproteobacteria bacterium]
MNDKTSKLVDNPLVNRTVMKRIITPVDKAHPPEGFQEAKVLFFIGGGRASGKTTVNNYLFDLLQEQGVAPEYVGKLGSYAFGDILDKPVMQAMRHKVNKYLEKKTDVGETDAPEKKSGGLGGKLLDHAIDTIFQQGSPAVVDNHMDNPAFVDKILAKAKEHGYETVMVSPHIRAETYFAREEHRFQSTGRPYDLKSGLQKHVGFAKALRHYEEAFDATLLLDNDKHGQAPTPIAFSVKGKVTVLDEGKYHDAQRKTGIDIDAKSADEVWRGEEQRAERGEARGGRAVDDRAGQVGKSTAQDAGARETAAGKHVESAGKWAKRVLSDFTKDHSQRRGL